MKTTKPKIDRVLIKALEIRATALLEKSTALAGKESVGKPEKMPAGMPEGMTAIQKKVRLI